MIEILTPATREEWLEQRKDTVGASESPALLDVHPFLTRFELWHRKAGALTKAKETPLMRLGRLLEPIAIAAVREDRPDWVIVSNPMPGGHFFRNGKRSATPDAKAIDPRRHGVGTMQVKTVSQWALRMHWLDDGEIDCPLYVAVQATQEAMLTNAAWACAAALVTDTGELHIVDVPLREGLRRRIEGEIEEFWNRIADNDPYPPDFTRDADVLKAIYATDDGSEIDLSGNAQAMELADRHEMLCSIERDASNATHIRKSVDAELRHLLGNAQRARLADGRIIEAKTTKRKGFTVEPTSFRAIKIKDAS